MNWHSLATLFFSVVGVGVLGVGTAVELRTNSAEATVFHQAALATRMKPVVVRVEPVTYTDEPVPIRATGVLSRKSEANLSFKVGGVIESVLVRVGDRVVKDQVLARLRLDEIEGQVAQAQSAFERARRDLMRMEHLQARDVVSLESLQNARTSLEVAAAQARIAGFNRQYAEIKAPDDGRILGRLAEPDELVEVGRPILGFAGDAEGWIIRAGLAERDVARVRFGDHALLSDGSQGRVTQISEAADPATRTVQVEIGLISAPPEARSGAVASVTLIPQAVAPRPAVPASVLIEGNGSSASLYLLEAGEETVRRVDVEVEALLPGRAYLRTDLPRSARLIVQGGEYVRDGGAVTIAH